MPDNDIYHRLNKSILFNETAGQMIKFEENPFKIVETADLVQQELSFFLILLSHKGKLVTHDVLKEELEKQGYRISDSRRIHKIKQECSRCIDTLSDDTQADFIIHNVRGKTGNGYKIDYMFLSDQKGRNIEHLIPPYGRPGKNAYFTGRSSIIEELHSNFENGSDIQILNGMGGMGKTSIALRYSYLYEKEYDLIHWIDGSSLDSILSSYKGFLKDTTEKDIPEDEGKLLRMYMEYVANIPSCLFIYDNCDFFSKEELNILRNKYLPQNHGHTIITSRSMEGMGTIYVDIMDEDDAVEFAMKRANSKDKEGARKLVKRLDRFPLAIDIASAYICADKGMSFEEYIGVLDKKISILEENDDTDSYGRKDRTIKEILEFTLDNISRIEQNDKLDEAIRELLYTSAFSYYDCIDLRAYGNFSKKSIYYFNVKHLCEYCKSRSTRHELKKTAIKYGLLKENGKDLLRIHPLQQEIIIEYLIRSYDLDRYSSVINDVYDFKGKNEIRLTDYPPEERETVIINANKNLVYCNLIQDDLNADKYTEKYRRIFFDDYRRVENLLSAYQLGIVDASDVYIAAKELEYIGEYKSFFTLSDLLKLYPRLIYLASEIDDQVQLNYYMECMEKCYSYCIDICLNDNAIVFIDHYIDLITYMCSEQIYRVIEFKTIPELLSTGLKILKHYFSNHSYDEYTERHNHLFEKTQSFSYGLNSIAAFMKEYIIYLINNAFTEDFDSSVLDDYPVLKELVLRMSQIKFHENAPFFYDDLIRYLKIVDAISNEDQEALKSIPQSDKESVYKWPLWDGIIPINHIYVDLSLYKK